MSGIRPRLLARQLIPPSDVVACSLMRSSKRGLHCARLCRELIVALPVHITRTLLCFQILYNTLTCVGCRNEMITYRHSKTIAKDQFPSQPLEDCRV